MADTSLATRRARLNGAFFGGIIGVAVALVQVVLFMAGTTSYNVAGSAANVSTAGSSDLTGYLILPFLIVAFFAGAGAILATRLTKTSPAGRTPYA